MSKFWNWVERNFYSKEAQNISERAVIEFILNTPKYRISVKQLAEHLGVFTKYAKQKLGFMRMKGVLANSMFLDNFWEQNFVINKRMLPKLSTQYPDLATHFQHLDQHTHSFLGTFNHQDFARVGEKLGEKLNKMLGVPDKADSTQKGTHQNLTIDDNTRENIANRLHNTILPTDGQIIQWALENQNTITATMLCVKANIPIEKAREILEKMHLKQVFDMQVNDKGVILYILQEI